MKRVVKSKILTEIKSKIKERNQWSASRRLMRTRSLRMRQKLLHQGKIILWESKMNTRRMIKIIWMRRLEKLLFPRGRITSLLINKMINFLRIWKILFLKLTKTKKELKTKKQSLTAIKILKKMKAKQELNPTTTMTNLRAWVCQSQWELLV